MSKKVRSHALILDRAERYLSILAIATLIVPGIMVSIYAQAEEIDSKDLNIDMAGFVLSGDFDVDDSGQQSGEGEIKNGNVGSYPEGSCVPVEIEVENKGDVAGEVTISPNYDYYNDVVGIMDLELITTSLGGNPADSADNLDDFTYTLASIPDTSYTTSSGGSVDAVVSGPYAGDDDGTDATSDTDDVRHYNIELQEVPAGETVYVLFCARLSVDAGEYPGASMNVQIAQGGNETIAIQANQLLALPSLTLTKVVEGGSATPDEWSFVVSPPIDGTSIFEIPEGEDTVVIDNVSPDGDYTITESGPDEYAFSSGTGANCAFTEDTATATLAAGDPATDAECVFTNTYNVAELTVTKVVVNDDEGVLEVEDFTLYVDQDEVVSGEMNTFAPGDYTVSEDGDLGYEASFSGDCDENGDITMEVGEVYECTITNDDIPEDEQPETGTITVTKVVVNDDGGELEVADFTLYVSQDTVVSGESNEFEVGDYVVSEDGNEGYEATFSGDCDESGNITLEADEDLECTITNDDIAVETGTITVTKVVVNDDGGELEVADFTLYVGQDTVVSGESNEFEVGDYVISEDGDEGYAATFSGDCDENGNITLEADEEGECTITNDDIPEDEQPETGIITVTKVVVNDDGGELEVADFTLYVGQDTVVSGESNEFEVGDYVISEYGNEGYEATFSGDCDESGNITLEADEDLECTITNDDIEDDDNGGGDEDDPTTLTIEMEMINDDGGDFHQQDFTVYVDNVEFTVGVETDVLSDTYLVREEYTPEAFMMTAVEDGYTTTFGGDCDSEGTVTVMEGQQAVCTIAIDDIEEDDGGGDSDDDDDDGGSGCCGGTNPPGDSDGGDDDGGDAPEPRVLGDFDEAPPVEESPVEESPAPEPRVLGVDDELPRTGAPAGVFALVPMLYFMRKRKK